MASKNPKPKRVEEPAVPAPVRPGMWESKIRPFLERRALPLAILLIAIGAVRIASTWSRFSFTNDEPQHFACGLEYLQRHTYLLEPEQPPLSRIAMAMGPFLDGTRLAGPSDALKGQDVAAIYQKGTPERTLILMRMGILPFFLLASVVVFLWARHHFGGATAVIATALFTWEPTILAHSGLSTTDMAVAACLPAAFLAMILWAERPSGRNAVLFGIASGSAVLAKFTTLLYLPAATALALLYYVAVERSGAPAFVKLARVRAASFGIALIAGAVTIWAGYLFSFGKFSGAGFPVPAPQLFQGIHDVLVHNQGGHPAFLLGQLSRTGWWYYFPVVLAVKTPLAFLLLAIFGVVLCLRRKAVPWALPVAFALGILLPAMAGHINIGLRHILPIYAGLSIAGAIAAVQLAEWSDAKRWAGPVVALALFWAAGTGIWNHPYYLAYFNELAGSHPENILVDSDLDWSQDYVELTGKLHSLHATEVNFGVTPWLNHYLEIWPGLPKTKPVQPLVPAPGWLVVNPSYDKLYQYGLMYRSPNLVPWWSKLTPVDHAGALQLYYVPPGAIRLRQPGQ
ncbi:MAG: glycosyl transferase, family 39 [Candidatus Solibacter sp.]|nr:glycosyl transferase, family 39 [Candidatus Solibacter sp.]